MILPKARLALFLLFSVFLIETTHAGILSSKYDEKTESHPVKKVPPREEYARTLTALAHQAELGSKGDLRKITGLMKLLMVLQYRADPTPPPPLYTLNRDVLLLILAYLSDKDWQNFQKAAPRLVSEKLSDEISLKKRRFLFGSDFEMALKEASTIIPAHRITEKQIQRTIDAHYKTPEKIRELLKECVVRDELGAIIDVRHAEILQTIHEEQRSPFTYKISKPSLWGLLTLSELTYITHSSFLTNFARHQATTEPIDEDLMEVFRSMERTTYSLSHYILLSFRSRFCITRALVQKHTDLLTGTEKDHIEFQNRLKTITHLSMINEQVTPHELNILGPFFMERGCLRSLNFYGGNLGHDGFKVLATILPHLSLLEELDLGKNALTNESIISLTQIIPANKCLKGLFIFDNDMTFSTAENLLLTLEKMLFLTALDIRECLLKDDEDPLAITLGRMNQRREAKGLRSILLEE